MAPVKAPSTELAWINAKSHSCFLLYTWTQQHGVPFYYLLVYLAEALWTFPQQRRTAHLMTTRATWELSKVFPPRKVLKAGENPALVLDWLNFLHAPLETCHLTSASPLRQFVPMAPINTNLIHGTLWAPEPTRSTQHIASFPGNRLRRRQFLPNLKAQIWKARGCLLLPPVQQVLPTHLCLKETQTEVSCEFCALFFHLSPSLSCMWAENDFFDKTHSPGVDGHFRGRLFS